MPRVDESVSWIIFSLFTSMTELSVLVLLFFVVKIPLGCPFFFFRTKTTNFELLKQSSRYGKTDACDLS